MKLLYCLLFLASSAFATITNNPYYNLDQAFVATCKEGANHQKHLATSPVTDRVKAILSANCIQCHGLGATGGSPKIKNILDVPGLIAGGEINKANPPASNLYYQITAANPRMPLGGTALSDVDKKSILDWITAGAEPFDGNVPPPPPSKFVSYASEEACIAANLDTLDKTQTPFYRYLTLTDVYNGDPQDLKRLVWAVNKTLNSVSREGLLVKAVPVGNPAAVLRFDLRDYALTFNDWERNLLPRYPFAINYFAQGGTDGSEVTTDERFIEKVTGSARAWLRADFFVETVSQPPVYYDFLRLPNNLTQFYRDLNINEARDIETFADRRSAFRHSGVANWNRIVDEHPLSYSVLGAQHDTELWRTFDVVSQIDTRNFFAFPFGPIESIRRGHSHAFTADASEIIYGLPNGLDAYFFVNGKGQRIDEALTAVATDRANSSPYIGTAPFVIRNGVSCMHCHAGGMNLFADELRASAAATTSFSTGELDEINALFAPKSEMDGLLTNHNVNFVKAIGSIIPDVNTAINPNTEPVFWQTKWYEGDLDIAQAASELGMPLADFQTCINHSPNLAADLGLGDSVNGRIQRQEWERHFGDAARECDLGLQIIFRGNTNTTCHTRIFNRTPYGIQFNLSHDGTARSFSISSGGTFTDDTIGDSIFGANLRQAAGYYIFRNYTLIDCVDYQLGIFNENVDLRTVN